MTPGPTRRASAAAHEWLVAQDAPEAPLEALEAVEAPATDSGRDGVARVADGGRDRVAGEGPESAGPGSAIEDARRWVRRILDDQDTRGAWGNSLLATAESLETLAEIRAVAALRERDPGIGRALEWLRGRRRAPGAWTDGCTPERHAGGTCHHFAGGFFAVTADDPPEAVLRNGAATSSEAETRFVASAAALGARLLWTEPTTDDRLHLETLRRVIGQWRQS
ncbi:MAG: hypothetical protein ACOCVZ_08855, partial [Gemmatimonadota bacterium]